MTAFFDPVVGAAAAAGLTRILPALPCPTCGVSKRVHVSFVERAKGWKPCPVCADGVWTPPDHPVTIGVTSARPAISTLDADTIVRGWMVDLDIDDELALTNYGIPGVETYWWHSIEESSVIGEGTLRPLKVVYGDHNIPRGTGELAVSIGGWNGDRLQLVSRKNGLLGYVDISSALPFLPGLKPGDTVYLLDGFTTSVRCPQCAGRGEWATRGDHYSFTNHCTPCHGSGRVSCPFPVDAPDHPCVTL